MLTFFTTAKRFRGHDGVIQRNALKSWTLLHPDIEVILFGNEEGAAEVCAELGLLHEPSIERHESKLPYVNAMFARAQQIARHEYLCYSNCDIIFLPGFRKAFEGASRARANFLGVGRRWDIDITEPLDFSRHGWDEDLRSLAMSRGKQMDDDWIDFFLFGKGLYKDIPPLIVGHCYWDNWMIWRTLSLGVPVIDFSDVTQPVHQNHGYNPELGRVKGIATDALSLRNLQLIGGDLHTRTIQAATHRISEDGNVHVNFRRYVPSKQRAHLFLTFDMWLPTWHFFLNATRPLRSVLGMRRK
jgi:hypothetical protein